MQWKISLPFALIWFCYTLPDSMYSVYIFFPAIFPTRFACVNAHVPVLLFAFFENFYVNWTKAGISMRSEYFHCFIVFVECCCFFLFLFFSAAHTFIWGVFMPMNVSFIWICTTKWCRTIEDNYIIMKIIRNLLLFAK